jgi:hypothetical protein
LYRAKCPCRDWADEEIATAGWALMQFLRQLLRVSFGNRPEALAEALHPCAIHSQVISADARSGAKPNQLCRAIHYHFHVVHKPKHPASRLRTDVARALQNEPHSGFLEECCSRVGLRALGCTVEWEWCHTVL